MVGESCKQNVIVIAESVTLKDIGMGQTGRQPRYFKAKVLNAHIAKEINHTIENNIDERSIVFMDKSTSYVDIAGFYRVSYYRKIKKRIKKTLKWVHITIGNAKRNLLGQLP